MRIIDKNKDYYDYLQDPTDVVVFDRRGSFILTKDIFKRKMESFRGHYLSKTDNVYDNVLLQCGATFWLLLLEMEFEKPNKWLGVEIKDYNFDLLATWKDYSKPNALLRIDLSTSDFGYTGRYRYNYKREGYVRKSVDPNEIINYFKSRSRVVSDRSSFSTYTTLIQTKKGFKSESTTSNIPILKDSGIASVVDPLELFCAIEEYFSINKTALERTEALGATNDDKIIMHGFDTKVSFRGKA